MKGYTQSELEDIQAKWSLRFPPDLLELLLLRRPLLPGGFDWISTSSVKVQGILDWPYEGLAFDVKHADLWWPEWGTKPENLQDRLRVLEGVVLGAPRLIPLSGHRYLPEAPFLTGNPVFSVYQSDIIYYGTDLADWLARERDGLDGDNRTDNTKLHREIPFWSEVVRRNR